MLITMQRMQNELRASRKTAAANEARSHRLEGLRRPKLSPTKPARIASGGVGFAARARTQLASISS
jgi:hypothetical protein